MPKCGKKNSERASFRKNKGRATNFSVFNFHSRLFLLARIALPWISEESVLYSALCVYCVFTVASSYLLLGSIIIRHGKSGRMGERPPAGHAVMTDDQIFDVMNGKGDSLLYRHESDGKASGRRREQKAQREPRQKFLL